MKRNNFLLHALHAGFLSANCPAIGGQAVMEGVMMRNGDVYGLAVRNTAGDICAQRLPWWQLGCPSWMRKPFIRGFPILLETMINGIQALNRSVAIGSEEDETMPAAGSWQIIASLGMAILMAVALFVLAPHLLSLLMYFLGLGGDVDGLSFHLWDGFYKCAIFIGYIWLISFVPDIHRVFEYHGAEHKTIHAWEKYQDIDAISACDMSRLHPRCGTTFILFVICISIILQAILVPLLLKIWTPDGLVAKHSLSIFYKLLLVIPISALAYEMIRFAARLPKGFWASILQAPGLALQRLTTCEPNQEQLDVALVALVEALDPEMSARVHTVIYCKLPAAGK